ncbi:hypothetical protein [Streptomyces sp. NPDC089919]|uniref:hypothetical protein n=1 Tax=Streptomyces sp. NPDC089919 TaxID=3155188 RepID=UPI003445B3D4
MSDDYVSPDFRPTHVVPQEGLPAWEAPDVSRPTEPLDPFLPVELLARRGEWAQILCANGWSAWVDGRLLVAVPQQPPTGAGPLSRAEDPLPLLARIADTLESYRQAADDLAAGRCDTEAFLRATGGLRAGVVVDGESVWLYDATSGRWMYGDGRRMTTFAAAVGPGSGSASARGPAGSAPAAAPAPAAPAAPVAPAESAAPAAEPAGPAPGPADPDPAPAPVAAEPAPVPAEAGPPEAAPVVDPQANIPTRILPPEGAGDP